MDFKKNIEYRRTLNQKVFEGEKLTDAEKQWLKSNPMFNESFEFPCYQRDAIGIPVNFKTKVIITVLGQGDKTKVYRPFIFVIGKGAIEVQGELLNFLGEKVNYKETRMLIPLLDENRTSTCLTVSSKDGLIGIAYQCEYFDERMQIQTREISDGAKITYAMKKEVVSKNEFIYNCKNPAIKNEESTQFDSFVFSVKIEDC